MVAHGLEYFADIILIRNVGAIRERNVALATQFLIRVASRCGG
jgi:hypothetical protein